MAVGENIDKICMGFYSELHSKVYQSVLAKAFGVFQSYSLILFTCLDLVNDYFGIVACRCVVGTKTQAADCTSSLNLCNLV